MSAGNVYSAINKEKYDVILGYITSSGEWYLVNSIEGRESSDNTQKLLPILGKKQFFIEKTNSPLEVDVILPILHGKNGEDGSVQGLAQLMHIPIVGCDMTASSVGMDKLVSKRIVQSQDLRVAPYVVYRDGSDMPDYQATIQSLGSPVFIKPTRAGSSVGVSKVHNQEEFYSAINTALLHDKTVLIEKAINARELEVAVLGSSPQIRVSAVGEIVPGEEFYSYDDKYSQSSAASSSIPANISDEQSHVIRDAARVIYESLGCTGLSRIDFFLDDSNEIYFNEINTLPGFTNISMYPKLWQYEGVSYSDLIDELITDAL